MDFEIKKKVFSPSAPAKTHSSVASNIQNQQSAALKGFLVNNYIKKQPIDSFETVSDTSNNNNIKKENDTVEQKSAFDAKKAIKPLVVTTLATIGTILGISFCVSKYSNHLASDKGLVRPPDLPRSMNIVEEYHLAMYRALREPSARNVAGLLGVGIFSAVALSAKSLVDGVKEVWIKKQNCDIDYDLQNNLIEVERDAFSGKLKIVDEMYNKNFADFSSIKKEDKKDLTFSHFPSFTGKIEENNKEDNKEDNKAKLALGALLGVSAFSAVLFSVFKNYQKTIKNLDTFVQKMTDSEIKQKLADAVNLSDKSSAIKELSDVLKSINAKEETMKEYFSKIADITEDEINKNVSKIKKEQIYAQAPEALGGVSEKIQYYCYVNEERGHLYNWILNPENKWNKYLFLSFCFVSGIGYIARSAAEAVKQVVVSRENSKSELNLRKMLVKTEINNFKAKKQSAIQPLIDNFNYQKAHGASDKALEEMSQNILLEIKNGPPYVYN